MKPFHLLSSFIFCLTFFLISGCTSNEIGDSKNVSQETIYQQYKISYNEVDENAVLYSQFRFAGDEGTTLVLTRPAGIRFDGVLLAVDSSEYEGAFYKKSIPVSSFIGNHVFTYTDINKKSFENRCTIAAFKLINIPEVTTRNIALQIPFVSSPLGTDDYIEMTAVDTDSSFTINQTPKENTPFLLIPAAELQRQKVSQLKLVATLRRKIPLQQFTTEGGKLELEHTLKPIIIKLNN